MGLKNIVDLFFGGGGGCCAPSGSATVWNLGRVIMIKVMCYILASVGDAILEVSLYFL